MQVDSLYQIRQKPKWGWAHANLLLSFIARYLDLKAPCWMFSCGLRLFLCAHLALVNATLEAQRSSGVGNGTEAIVWTQNEVKDPMTSSPMARLTAVTPVGGGFKVALICGDESREAARALGMMGSWAISLEIEPVDRRLKYKLHNVPPTTTVTVNQYFPNGPVTGTGTTSGGGYTAMPSIRIDQTDAKAGGGDAGQLKFDFLAPADMSRSAIAFSADAGPNETVGARNMRKGVSSAISDAWTSRNYIIRDLVQGRKVLIEQELSDGSKVYLSFDLQDESVRHFVNACAVSNKTTLSNVVGFPVPNLPLRQPEEFQGNVAQFDAALPDLLKRAALQWKMPANTFDKEASIVSKAADSCSGITADTYNRLPQAERIALDRPGAASTHSDCTRGLHNATNQVPTRNPGAGRKLLYQILPVGSWREGNAIELQLMMSGLDEDGATENLFGYYGVLEATIKVSPHAAAPAMSVADAAAEKMRMAADAEKGYWTDPETKLVWAKRDSGDNNDVTWQQAVDYCKNLRLAGSSDWRLPTREETNAMYDPLQPHRMDCCNNDKGYNVETQHSESGLHLNVYIKGELQITGWEWTSTRLGDDASQSYVYRNFAHPGPLSMRANTVRFMRALCVRDPSGGSSGTATSLSGMQPSPWPPSASAAGPMATVRPSAIGSASAPEEASGDQTGQNAPRMDRFQILATTIRIHESVTATSLVYSALGSKSVLAVMMRANDGNGRPVGWAPVQRTQVGNTVDGGSAVTLKDVPPAPGKYWYGMHLFDQPGHEIYERAPVLVTVTQ
jgi:hypothetical protein